MISADKPEFFAEEYRNVFDTGVLGNINLYNLFLPQILKGKVKKVIFTSSGHADLDFVNAFDIDVCSVYSAGKAAMNIINAKYSAQYKKDGVLFLSISPGMVDVGHFSTCMICLLPSKI